MAVPFYMQPALQSFFDFVSTVAKRQQGLFVFPRGRLRVAGLKICSNFATIETSLASDVGTPASVESDPSR